MVPCRAPSVRRGLRPLRNTNILFSHSPRPFHVEGAMSDLEVQFRISERFAPGHFDIWFSSHQIFHVSIYAPCTCIRLR
ncbi:hypothetical protein NOF04DRAFT_1336577 [Fusarium oxysporum II5]|nr:hypothetical protein NOF04DRAFT_1337000 [Fusarium oxysporum II5]KAK2122047.1 hypothetical protein NOF04DRAFT_1336577 [Fusarium oxysporum II5]